MRATVELNILPMGGLHDRSALTRWIADTAPHEAILVMNDPMYAVELSQYAKHTIHRQQRQDDASLFMHMSPNEFVDGLPDIGEVVYHQILNEPGGGELRDKATQIRMADWVAQAMVYARSKPVGRRKRLAGPSHAVGNPHESFFPDGVYDPILKSLRAPTDRTNWHLILQHEYFANNPTAERPYHIGRVFLWRERARYLRGLGLSILDPKVVIGEAGRDLLGKKGPDGHGWKNAEWIPKTPEEYWNRLQAQASVYREYGYPMLVFCVGEGFGDWISYDIQKEDVIFQRMAAYNLSVPDIPIGEITVPPLPLPPGTPTAQGVVTQIPGSFVNIREAPDAASRDIGDALPQEKVEFAEPASQPGWYWVKTAKVASGWISKQSGNVVISPEIVQPPIEGSLPQFTKEELLTIASLHREIAAVFEAAASRVE
jgi:hypothetical protein